MFKRTQTMKENMWYFSTFLVEPLEDLDWDPQKDLDRPPSCYSCLLEKHPEVKHSLLCLQKVLCWYKIDPKFPRASISLSLRKTLFSEHLTQTGPTSDSPTWEITLLSPLLSQSILFLPCYEKHEHHAEGKVNKKMLHKYIGPVLWWSYSWSTQYTRESKKCPKILHF